MTVTKDSGHAMEQVLLQQVAMAEQMEQVLGEENKALVTRDASSIENLAQRKSELSETLAALTLQQQALLAQTGLSFSRDGIDQFVSSLPKAEKQRLRESFNRLQQLLENCQRQNLINGNIISANRQAAEMALAILRGQHQRGPSLYNANGQASPADPGNTLAKA